MALQSGVKLGQKGQAFILLCHWECVAPEREQGMPLDEVVLFFPVGYFQGQLSAFCRQHSQQLGKSLIPKRGSDGASRCLLQNTLTSSISPFMQLLPCCQIPLSLHPFPSSFFLSLWKLLKTQIQNIKGKVTVSCYLLLYL